ncbi:MAG TPA: SGNH/GDSL hydrolase family protein [Nocardioides sp.]|nr:SGNH/GDSL hydrolase family protein [Nocardioides sp.]
MTAPARVASVLALAVLALVGAGCSGSSSSTAATAPGATGSSGSSGPALSLVAIGDSIPYNASFDCPGCVGFVDQYAEALADATGQQVETSNLSDHTGLDLPTLMTELHGFKKQLGSADAIIVGIAHNTIELNAERPCGTTFDETTSTFQDWSEITRTCSDRSVARWRPVYNKLYSTIAGWRSGRPTVLLTIDKYNDWVGWRPAHLTPEQARKTVMFHDAWNRMLCHSAEAHGFTCVDIYHAFNGPHGTRPLGTLVVADYTHPSQAGNDVIAKALVAQGFAPLA